MGDRTVEVAVVGGGIAGLTLAWHLARHGVDSRVFESGARPGGNIRSEARQGYLCEWGPNGFLASEPAMLRLIEAMGLGDRTAPAGSAHDRRFLVRGGRLRALPASPPGFLVSDALSLRGRLRVLLEWTVPPRRGDGDESVFDFAARRIGREAALVLVDAMVTGVYAGDSRRLSLAAAFPRMREMETRHGGLFRALIAGRREARAGRPGGGGPMGPAGRLTSFSGGMETLVRALAGALGDRLELDAAVSRLSPAPPGWRLETARGAVSAGQVVLAVPAWRAAPLVAALDPDLGAELGAIAPAPIAVVCLGYAERDLAAVPPGFGFLVPAGERLPLLGTLFDTWVFPGRSPAGKVLWRALIGGARDPDAVSETDDRLVERALDTFARLLSLRAAPEMTHVIRHRHGIPQYAVGHPDRLRRIEARLAALPGLHLTGNSYRGIAMNACVKEAETLAAALAGGRGSGREPVLYSAP